MRTAFRLVDWFRLEQGMRPEVERYRRELLGWVARPFFLIGIVAVGIGAWRAWRAGQWPFAVTYVGVYAVCVLLVGSPKLLSVRARSVGLLAGLFAIAVAGTLRLGLSGVGVLVMVVTCGLTAILRGARASLWALGLSVAAILIVGWAVVDGVVVIGPAQLQASMQYGAWVSVALTFFAITFGLIVPFQSISAMLIRSLDSLEIQAGELSESNEQLRREMARRERAEAALRASEARYRTIFESAAVSIWQEDLSAVHQAFAELRADGVEDLVGYIRRHPDFVRRAAGLVKIEDVNQATLVIYGADSKAELLTSLHRVYAPESPDAFRDVLIALVEKRRFFEAEAVNLTLDGKAIDVLVRMAIPEDPADPVLVSVLDITDRKMLERSLAQAQKMEAIGTLAGGIAHDFNNLLMGIQGHVSLMLHRAPTAATREHLRSIDGLVDSGAGLTRQLLGFAHGGKYDVQTTDLAKLLDRSVSLFGRAKKEIRTRHQAATDLWTVDVDRSQLEQVLLNLYVNAWHAMPDGGDLTVAASNVTLGADDADTLGVAAGDFVRTAVTDTGCGMDEPTLARVFEPFFTTKDLGRGTGLGLASAYGIVKNHGGALTAQSNPGEGATFLIHLPASKKTVPTVDDGAEVLRQGSETVLLVDDERAVRKATAMMLEELGYQVVVASGGADAVRRFDAEPHRFALVILDMIMPDMSGPEVFDRLRVRSESARVLLSSGYSFDDNAAELLQRGCRGFIQKPFQLSELSAKLREVLDAE